MYKSLNKSTSVQSDFGFSKRWI